MADATLTPTAPALQDMSKTGVYCITNIVSGRRYVGSTTVSFRSRWQGHKNRHLLRAWNLYGKDAFTFTILEECELADCIDAEQRHIDALKAADKGFGYNLRPKARNNFGHRHSPETIARMSAAAKGRPRSPETLAKMSASNRGRTLTPEHRAKVAAAGIGRVTSDETRAKISAVKRGKKFSLEVKARMAAAQRLSQSRPEVKARMAAAGDARRGKKMNAKSRAKMSAQRKGIKRSDEYKAKMSAAKMGWKPAPETIAKMRVAAKARWDVRRAKRLAATGEQLCLPFPEE